MRVSEIRVKRIRVNQGLGVIQIHGTVILRILFFRNHTLKIKVPSLEYK